MSTPEGSIAGKNIKFITCLCWDDPYVDTHTEEIKDFIIRMEQGRLNKITPYTKIVVTKRFDADIYWFYKKESNIRQTLRDIYDDYYDESNLSTLALNTVEREAKYKDGHVLVRNFVLYE